MLRDRSVPIRNLLSVVPIIRAFCFRSVQSNLAFVVLQMDAFRERSVHVNLLSVVLQIIVFLDRRVLALRKGENKRLDEVLQEADGGA